MPKTKLLSRRLRFLVMLTLLLLAETGFAQPRAVTEYIVGPHDVLTITCYDQADLSGKFIVEADGTFTFPLIGRVKVGGLALRTVEAGLKAALRDGGFFRNPQITVAVEQYKSQRIFVVGEVRTPGTYPLSGDMSLIEALARAGSTLPSASDEVIIVHAVNGQNPTGPTLPKPDEGTNVVHVSLRDLERGAFTTEVTLGDGDTVLVPRAENVYVFGQVKSPGAYPLPQKNTTILQALSLAGGVTDRGSMTRIRIVRTVNGEKKEFRVKLTDLVQSRDTIIVPERFF